MNTSNDHHDGTLYTAVMNHEEQYSIWPVNREVPAGWKRVGEVGARDQCLAFIKQVWTDMRPLSLRLQMEMVAAGAD